MVATLCANVMSATLGWGGAGWRSSAPPAIRFSQSSEKLKMQLEFDWPFFGVQPVTGGSWSQFHSHEVLLGTHKSRLGAC